MSGSPFTPEQKAEIRSLIRQEIRQALYGLAVDRAPAMDYPFTVDQFRAIEELIDRRWRPLGDFLEAAVSLGGAVGKIAAQRTAQRNGKFDGWFGELRSRWAFNKSRRIVNPALDQGDDPRGDRR